MADSGRNGAIQSGTGPASQTHVHHCAAFDSTHIDIVNDPIKRLDDVTSLRKTRSIAEHFDAYDVCFLGHTVCPACNCARDMSAVAKYVLGTCRTVRYEYGPLDSSALKFDMSIVNASVDDVRDCASTGCVIPISVLVRRGAKRGAC
jgi:hypothetical protein